MAQSVKVKTIYDNPLPIKTPKQRLKIYKHALAITLGVKPKPHSNCTDGLCILLKEVSNRDFFRHDLPETDILFPEFGKFINGYHPTKFLLFYKDGSRDKWRIKVLKECINLCNK